LTVAAVPPLTAWVYVLAVLMPVLASSVSGELRLMVPAVTGPHMSISPNNGFRVFFMAEGDTDKIYSSVKKKNGHSGATPWRILAPRISW
jgi:hypothetical protein